MEGQGAYGAYFGSVVAGVAILIAGLAGPFTTVKLLGRWWFRVGIFAGGAGLWGVAKRAEGIISGEGGEDMYYRVLSAGVGMLVVLNGGGLLVSLGSYLCRPFEVAAREDELEKSRERGGSEGEAAEWDRRYREKQEK